jgi:hypothetical protein
MTESAMKDYKSVSFLSMPYAIRSTHIRQEQVDVE